MSLRDSCYRGTAIRLTGAATCWDDIVFEMTPLRAKNPANASKPDWDSTNNGYLFPRNDATEWVYITAQLPHRYKEGSTIYPHVHVQQGRNEQAVFKIDYQWYNIGSTVPVAATYTMNTYGTTYVSGTIGQLIKGAAGIAGTGKTISSILKMKLYRDDNAYAADMLLDQFDIHIEIDGFGSETEYSKT